MGAPVAVSGDRPQRAGAVSQNAVHQVGRVDVLPALERREQPDPDVDRAVANRKYPPIPGQMVPITVANVQVALDPGLVVQGALEIAPDRHAQGERAVAGGAERPTEPGIRAVGHDDVAGPDRPDLVRFGVADHRAPEQPAVDDRGDRLRALPQRRPRLDRLFGDHLVELAPADDVAERREVGMLGPGELEGDAVRDRAQTVEALEAGEAIREAHVVELADGARREPVAAGLLARKVLLFDRHDRMATRREPVRRRRAGRSPTHDQHVDFVGGIVPHTRAHEHMITCSEGRKRSVIQRAAQCAVPASTVVARATRPT